MSAATCLEIIEKNAEPFRLREKTKKGILASKNVLAIAT